MNHDKVRQSEGKVKIRQNKINKKHTLLAPDSKEKSRTFRVRNGSMLWEQTLGILTPHSLLPVQGRISMGEEREASGNDGLTFFIQA